MSLPSFRLPKQAIRAWWASTSEMQKDHLKLLLVFSCLFLAGLALYFISRPSLRRWERDQALGQAKEFAGRKDYRSALLALQRAMAYDGNDAAGWKQVADFLGDIGSPEVLVARRNLVVLSPDDVALRLGFVLDALRFGDVASAKEIFGAVGEGAREEVNFFRMAAAIAYVTGQTGKLEMSMEEIVRRNPADRTATLDLAAIRLWGTDAGRAASAKEILAGLLPYPEVKVRAAVELLKFAAQEGDRNEARSLVARLHREFIGRPAPQATSVGTDALTEPPGWTAVVEAIKSVSARTAPDAAVVARWLGSIGQTREALVWLEETPENIRTSRLVSAASLELAVAADDEERLRPLLLSGAWGNAQPAIVDLAFAARWQRKMGRTANGQVTWNDAIAQSSDSLSNLRVLTRLAMAWKDPVGAEDAMLAVVEHFPSERWAWEALKLEYAQRQETTKLWELYAKWSRAQPENRIVVSDWIMLSLLVDHGSPEIHARAKDFYEAAPTDAASVIVYAVSLRAQKRSVEALTCLDRLPAADRELPRALLWRSVLLAEAGQKYAARSLMARVDLPRLLPEEVQVWKEANALSATSALSTPNLTKPAGSTNP